jgi:tRNA modification GTPase
VLLAHKAKSRASPALAPSLARCRHHVAACLAHLRRAHAAVLERDPAELLALALREAIDELGAMAGAVYTDDLLDRIFSRFCIGK